MTTPLQTNLMHLCLKRKFRVMGYMLAAGVVLLAAGAAAGRLYPVLMCPASTYVGGIFVGSLQVEVLTKLFTYDFPGYAKMLVRVSCAILLIARLW